MVKSASENKFLVRLRKFLPYAGSSFICFCATVLLLQAGSAYGADNTFSAIDRSFSILLFVLYSSLVAPILLGLALRNLTIHSVWRFFAPALSLSITLIAINAFPLRYVLGFFISSWLVSLIFFFFRTRRVAKIGLLCNRFLALGIILTIISIPYHWWVREGFPGKYASMQSRHEWALDTFVWSYSQATQVVNNCPDLVEHLGEIQQIAPTEGRNYSINHWADPTVYGFTLEVVGTRETGIIEVSKGYIGSAEISPPELVIPRRIFGAKVIPISDCGLARSQERN
ncbi:hypothetical protein [Vacuolonema iberomarrocanum]|uniref:hypothetical protein n=1 Tax=Vacuolonema iberomarrocanum TaxID=3454632 RepID=UPI0019ED3780|nr:hypothetical protein [filamentous cyanobacterium LEGE 07170]